MVAYKYHYNVMITGINKGIKKRFPTRASDYMKKRIAEYAQEQLDAGHDIEANKYILELYYGKST